MKDFLLVLFFISIIQSCDSPKKESQNDKKDHPVETRYHYDQSSVDFSISDSSGFDLTFYKHKDSTVYRHFRFRAPESARKLMETLPTLAAMWQKAQTKIVIQLNAINVGYPLIYRDVLTPLIQAFSKSEKWVTHVQINGQKIDHQLVEAIILESNIYPLEELLVDFGYVIVGISVEKVGVVEPMQLISLGFDESLIIPMPYMVWIEIKKKE